MKRKIFNSFIVLLTFCIIFTTLNPGQVLAQTNDNVESQTQQSVETLSEDSILPSSEEPILEDNYLEEINFETEDDFEAEDYVEPTDEINSEVQPLGGPLYVIPAIIKGFQISAKWYVKKYGKDYATTGVTTNLVLRNGALSGTFHAVTKVAFKEGFPVFNSTATVNLPFNLLKSANTTQFSYANKQLLAQTLKSPSLSKLFSQKQLQDLVNGNTPENYIWHHHQNTGVLQLVDKVAHEKTGHTGGKSIWGS